MRKVPVLLVLPPILFFGLAYLFYAGMQRDNPDELPSVFIGAPAPNLPGEPLGAYDLATQEYLVGGEVTIVNFWASWCPPCRAEHPTLLALKERGIPLIGVNFKDEYSAALTYLNELENPFVAQGFDPNGRSAIDWGVTAPPETFIIGGDGTVLFRFIGPLVASDYEQRFLPALERALAN